MDKIDAILDEIANESTRDSNGLLFKIKSYIKGKINIMLKTYLDYKFYSIVRYFKNEKEFEAKMSHDMGMAHVVVRMDGLIIKVELSELFISNSIGVEVTHSLKDYLYWEYVGMAGGRQYFYKECKNLKQILNFLNDNKNQEEWKKRLILQK